MLALKSYEQSTGFSALSADELYFINGGSGLSEVIQKVLPPGIKVTDSGVSIPFGKGEIVISGSSKGITLGFKMSW